MSTTMTTMTAHSSRGNSHHFNYLFITNKRSHFKQHAHSKDGKRLRTWRWLVSRTENRNVHLAFGRIPFAHMPFDILCSHYLRICSWTCGATAIVKCVHVAVIVCHRFAHRRTINGKMVWSIGCDCAHIFSAIFQHLSIDGKTYGRNVKTIAQRNARLLRWLLTLYRP